MPVQHRSPSEPPVDRVRVLFDSEPVGTLTMSASNALAFAYDQSWLTEGLSISPLSLPLREGVFVARRDPLNGMFGVFDDSMPDGWGRLLTDRMLRQRGIEPSSVSVLSRLSIVGSSGMGALEYEPAADFAERSPHADLDDIALECAQLLKTDFSPDLDRLFALGGSSGGARPKILTELDGRDWIIKFPSSVDSANIGEQEYAISQIARECGISMPQTRLFPSQRCSGYFGAQRFDRELLPDGSSMKVHMVSAGGLLETSHRLANLDYSLLMRLTMRICGSIHECERLYRLMCFNVFIGNRDDHAKNFSYLYDRDNNIWKLSPAYDLTENPGINGEHATTVDGKGRDIGTDNLVAVGVRAGISRTRCMSYAKEIRECIADAGFSVQS
ncbi:type II toxin-antitoxin system HipA family toxin [Bifidobacterium subtile]|uniref:HipA domain-containing protein n=1 Tax=Bifidobacterium subtile TaxID=77635 RepID=A0A087E848_9BIFI|nr:type II toxin-antitoxin system HipA family toxin [Bifidobacterium subtile]KFJ03949.1 HipA domain-containing protein [Bifidobacterium subtile]QOL36009.1 type II toxin-antitoxin system HipA family toxin [Bifidobacterium subtile]